MISLLYVLTVYRGKMRQDLADLYFPHLHRALQKAKRFDIWLQPLISLIHGIIVWSAGFGRHVSWRGISYRLAPDGKIERSWRSDDPAVLPMPGVVARRSQNRSENSHIGKQAERQVEQNRIVIGTVHCIPKILYRWINGIIRFS